MTSKQRMHAALAGQRVDRTPATVLYNQLYHADHFGELTGLPQWEYHRWLCMEPAEHVALLRGIVRAAPFECVQPQLGASREERQSTQFIQRDGRVHRHDRRTGRTEELSTISGHARDYAANETQYVFDARDIAGRVKLRTARERLAEGELDFAVEAVRQLGADHFILTGGVIGTLYCCHSHVGLTNLYAMLAEQPSLIHELSKRILEQNIEEIRWLAHAGGDAIYIDDAMTTSDMISPAHFEEFSLPYVRQMVREIHTLGHKAIIIYFGGIADRLDLIAAIGADGLSMETSMKNYVNDIGQIAQSIGRRVSLFGNVDPVGMLERAGDEELEAEMRRQAGGGARARGYIACTGSPITPATPLSRVRRFLELGAADGSM